MTDPNFVFKDAPCGGISVIRAQGVYSWKVFDWYWETMVHIAWEDWYVAGEAYGLESDHFRMVADQERVLKI
jgi:hypothetical protein